MLLDHDETPVEFVEEVIRDYKMMMPRMKKEGEDWTRRVPPIVTLEDAEEGIPKFNYINHMVREGREKWE